MIRLEFAAAAAAVVFLGSLAAAHAEGGEDPPHVAKSPEADVYAWMRVRETGVSSFAVDATGTKSGQTGWLETRFRLGGRLALGDSVRFAMELDAIDGVALGNRTTVGSVDDQTLRARLDRHFGISYLQLRSAYLSVPIPYGELRIGEQLMHFGLGVVLHDGAGEPDFGVRRFGTRWLGATLSYRPWGSSLRAPEWLSNLSVLGSADVVVRDDHVDLLRGDRALRGLFGLLTGTSDFGLGLVEILSADRDAVPDGAAAVRTTTVTSDLFARLNLAGDDKEFLRLEAEAAFVAGRTDRAALTQGKDGDGVRALGGVLRLRYDDDRARITAKTDLGLATALGDPGAGLARTFTFNADDKMGMILFDQVQALRSARAADLAVPFDPSGGYGSRAFASQGAIARTVFWSPLVLRIRPPGLDVRVGYLVAWRAGADTEAVVRDGHGHLLGHEVDLSARVRFPFADVFAVRVGFELGALFVGDAATFVTTSGDTGTSSRGAIFLGRAVLDLEL